MSWTCTHIESGATYAGETAEAAYAAYLTDRASEMAEQIDIPAAVAEMAQKGWDDADVTLAEQE